MHDDKHTTTHACRSACPEYAVAALCLLPIAMIPFLIITYLLYLGVKKHAVYVWKEGNFFTRYYHAMMDSRDTWCKYFGIGFFLAMNDAYTEAKENGEWRVRHCFVCMSLRG